MIRARARASASDLIRRLRTSGERIALGRAQALLSRRNDHGHRWRSATRLWPDIFEER